MIEIMGICTKFPDLWDVKIEKNVCQRKNNYTQDNIYVVRQFAYVHGVVGISLLSGKKIQSATV